ncbi:DUF4377 domain-containing protein [Variovorax sp. DXTD-1]|uniref:DUF4377 domain-containing protein n=1 Tax=Variovorax sp. DXTD-1 TaxID=2495592 RepID=UPI000F8679E3|nr:DUF4377 domain-containing protein [Variovorax sp. DXTD-1]RST45372.1 DUF4377 domain-containing protein [Variovorax sp. DXTD-1]
MATGRDVSHASMLGRWLSFSAAVLTLGLLACTFDPTQRTPAHARKWESVLPGYQWTLESAFGVQSRLPGDARLFRAERPVSLNFRPDAQLDLQGGCNQFGGAYEITADSVMTAPRLSSTRRACAPALMQADAALVALLAQPLQLQLTADDPDAPRLQVSASDQSRLVFVGQPTPEKRYGKAILMFLEVAPRRKACQGMMLMNCLQVRERRYDAQGLALGSPGAWQYFYDSIEGYTHVEGTRDVLRVKRFQRPEPAPAPADASSHVYVLDMVVESEAAAR